MFWKLSKKISITKEQTCKFKKDGYVVIKGLISHLDINRALRTINTQIGEAALSDSIDLEEFKPDRQCDHDDIVNLLYKTHVWNIVKLMFGHSKVGKPRSGQVALRFPNASKDADSWHIDGNGEILPFNLLIGISLCDQTSQGGCLFVFPGSHWKIQNELSNLKSIKLLNAQEIILKAGDVVFLHQMTAHYAGRNLSHKIRYQVYFRIWHEDIQEDRKLILYDIFAAFKGLQNRL